MLAAKLYHFGALLDALETEEPVQRCDLFDDSACGVMTITLDQELMLGVSWVPGGVVMLAFDQNLDFHSQRGQQRPLAFEARRPEELLSDLPWALRPCLERLLGAPRLRRLATMGLWGTNEDVSRIGYPLSGECGEEVLNDFILEARPHEFTAPGCDAGFWVPRYLPCGLAHSEYADGSEWVRHAHVKGPLVLSSAQARCLTNGRSRLPRWVSEAEARSRVSEFARGVAAVGLVLSD